MRLALCPVVLLAVVSGVAPAAGQVHAHEQPDWIEDVGVAGANMLTGGVTGAVLAWARGGDPTRGFVRGAAGGGVVFVGKRLAVARFSGAGLVGRQVSAAGSSLVASADTDPIHHGIWLPVGPVWLRVSGPDGLALRIRLREVFTLAWAATSSELEMDWARSLATGTATFRANKHRIRNSNELVNGVTIGSVILLYASSDPPTERHELVHVLQDDFMTLAWSRPLEGIGWRALMGRDLPLDIGLVPQAVLPRPLRLLGEGEAEVLENR